MNEGVFAADGYALGINDDEEMLHTIRACGIVDGEDVRGLAEPTEGVYQERDGGDEDSGSIA